MLQIITGRFFSGGTVNEGEADAILYSNFSWIAPIKLNFGELRPVDICGSHLASYVLRYTNRYEPPTLTGKEQAVLVLPQADQAVEQFRLLASLYFQSFFHVDRNYVEVLCRTQPSHSFDSIIPNAFVPKFFDRARTGAQAEVQGFVHFIDKVLSMPRKQYRLLISCLEAYFDALEVLGDNFDLAYSLMVYMFEALSKTATQPEPVWGDYDQNVRGKLDTALADIDPTKADEIRAILLQNAHLKLKKRFITFIVDHVEDSYFTSEAEGLKFAIAKSELRRTLANLYDARSGYVHELKQVQDQLRLRWVGTECDVFRWLNEPHFTFAGLVRLGRHVLATFIDRQPILQQENYPEWRNELPGVHYGEFAPQYWVWRADNFQPAQARHRFSGFVAHLLDTWFAQVIRPLALFDLMQRIEELVPNAKAADRVPMLALYWMYNGVIPPQDRRPNWDAFLSPWESELDKCSIEVMVIHVFWDKQFTWSIEECVATFHDYLRTKYKRGSTHLPRRVEIAIMSQVANLYLATGNVERYELWLDRSILDAAGSKAMQDYLRQCRTSKQSVNIQHILGQPLITDDDIRLKAYLNWEAAGKPDNMDVQFWLEAEQILRSVQ